MPELPEAETIVRGLRQHLPGHRIERVETVHADVLREPPATFADRLRGARIEALDRRGKNVLLRLDGGRVLAVNLGMTGRLLPFAGGRAAAPAAVVDGAAGPSAPATVGTPTAVGVAATSAAVTAERAAPTGRDLFPGTATHPAIRFHLDADMILVFDDTRRFGTVECLSASAWLERSARMGPEPLAASYTAAKLQAGLGRSRAPVRSWLLDQRRIAGVGNIYANEALYLARIHPQRAARDVADDGAAALHRALRRVLRNAIEAGGTTIRDYRNAEGSEGRYARRLEVYGREGETCRRCRATVVRDVFGGRAAFFCPTCQPAPAR